MRRKSLWRSVKEVMTSRMLEREKNKKAVRRGDDLKEEKDEELKQTRGVKENEEGAVTEERGRVRGK